MIDAEAAGTSATAAMATSASRRSVRTVDRQGRSVRIVRTWWKLLLNPILRRFGWSFVSVVDTSTDSVLRHELRRYPEHCRVLEAVTIHDLPPGMSRTGDGWAVWPFERCKSPECRGRRVTVGFEVSDEDWEAVMKGEPENIVCLTCFDERAQEKGVRYTLAGVHPTAWFDACD